MEPMVYGADVQLVQRPVGAEAQRNRWNQGTDGADGATGPQVRLVLWRNGIDGTFTDGRGNGPQGPAA